VRGGSSSKTAALLAPPTGARRLGPAGWVVPPVVVIAPARRSRRAPGPPENHTQGSRIRSGRSRGRDDPPNRQSAGAGQTCRADLQPHLGVVIPRNSSTRSCKARSARGKTSDNRVGSSRDFRARGNHPAGRSRGGHTTASASFGVARQGPRKIGIADQKTTHRDQYGQGAVGWQRMRRVCGPAARLSRAGLRPGGKSAEPDRPRGRIGQSQIAPGDQPSAEWRRASRRGRPQGPPTPPHPPPPARPPVP